MLYIINKYGWTGSNGCPSFRHTIEGSSDRGFNVVYDAGSIWVRHEEAMNIIPHWTTDDLLNAAGRKLNRLILVRGR